MVTGGMLSDFGIAWGRRVDGVNAGGCDGKAGGAKVTGGAVVNADGAGLVPNGFEGVVAKEGIGVVGGWKDGWVDVSRGGNVDCETGVLQGWPAGLKVACVAAVGLGVTAFRPNGLNGATGTGGCWGRA